MRIGLIGCGFLGSLFSMELAKRLYAANSGDELALTLVDDDVVKARNVGHQGFDPYDVGEPKADRLRYRLEAYCGDIYPMKLRVDRDHCPPDILECDVLVSAVDNLPSRQFLWTLGKHRPVLHLGISQGGTGAVEWTTPDFDDYSLSPINLADCTPEQVEAMAAVREMPPCELAVLRPLGLLTAYCGAMALAMYGWSIDPEGSGYAGQTTSWSTSLVGYQMRGGR